MGYNARKAAQTIAYFAIQNGCEPMNVVRAQKLVYLADRESIRRYGFPILAERRVSMKHGPVNLRTYEHINGDEDPTQNGWADFLRDRANHEVGLANTDLTEDDLDELSDADITVLNTVWEQFGRMATWGAGGIRDWTHNPDNIPEWEDPHGSIRDIPLHRIMRNVGVPNPTEQADLVHQLDHIDDLFKSLAH